MLKIEADGVWRYLKQTFSNFLRKMREFELAQEPFAPTYLNLYIIKLIKLIYSPVSGSITNTWNIYIYNSLEN